MKLVPCDACGAHKTASGCCPNCSNCKSKAKLALPAVALLGLIACAGGDETGDTDDTIAEPEYGVPQMQVDE